MELGCTVSAKVNNPFYSKIIKYIKRYWFIYMLVLPGAVHLVLFKYLPMYGIFVAFERYSPIKGVFGSRWVGLENFNFITRDTYFYKVLWNTVIINIYNLTIGFAFVVLLALILNEIRISILKRVIQTVVYLPNFVSWVVFAGLITVVLSPSEGFINKIIELFGKESIYFLIKPEYFQFILVISNIVKTAGFGTIIYLAAISGVNPELYESAKVDGAHRGHMIIHITLPRIYPTIAVMLILGVSNLFGSNFDQVYNLYNPLVYDTGDVLSTYMYRTGLLQGKFEMSTALGLVFNALGLFIVILANKIINKLNVMGIF